MRSAAAAASVLRALAGWRAASAAAAAQDALSIGAAGAVAPAPPSLLFAARHASTTATSNSSRRPASRRTRRDEEEVTSFGYETVSASAKAPRVRAVFDAVAPAYDLMNDAMSAGLHRLWKDATVSALGPALAAAGVAHLDLAGGTGDIARRVAARLASADADAAGGAAMTASLTGKPPTATPTSTVTVCDVNEAMMAEGRRAAGAGERGWTPQTASIVDWVVGDAEALPFPDASFDSATIAFGLRNVTRPAVALREIVRVLKPGGAFACLEFSQVSAPPLAALYDAWSFHAIPRLGAAIHGDAAPYQYLVESIRRFPSKRALAAMMEEAGFGGVRVRSFAAGAVALHQGWKV